MKFTDKGLQALQPQKARYEVWEEGRTGLGLRISPKGRKSWVWMYRYNGKARRVSFGTYPQVGLADVHVRLASAKKQLSGGVDPGASMAVTRQEERDAESVSELAELYLEKWARPRKRSASEDERILRRDVLPLWGDRKARSIVRRDVIALLDGIVRRGSPIAANRTLAVTRKMFNFAIGRDILSANPCLMIATPTKEVPRDRMLNSLELQTFWRNLPNTDMSKSIQLLLKFMLVTAQRKGEIIRAEWVEFDFETAIWTIPASKAKNGLAHRVPLSSLAIELLSEVRGLTPSDCWVFLSPRTMRPFHDTAVDHALKGNRAILKTPDLTPHDLRRTAASHISRLGINRLVVAKILNHAEVGITATYDRHGYDREKREALEAWATEIAAIVQ
jgi:integrase